jgi:putative oxidoreductase
MSATMSEVPRPARRPDSIIALLINMLVRSCGIVPYALVALGLRFVMARVFFMSGQGKIDGPAVPIPLGDHAFSVVLPAGIKGSTFELFETQYANLPMPPAVAAYVFTYAEFLLPLCLLLGFATRVSALLLLLLTLLLQLYVAPGALWTAHAYCFAILAVLMSVGPGAISVDGLIRHVYEK